MKINPDSPDFQNRVDNTSGPAKGDKAFAASLGTKGPSAAATSSTQPLAGIAQGFSKADLTDPAKANTAIHQAVNEIMDREFSGMQPPDRERVASWMRGDPVIRETLLKQLTALAS
jgi:hypothetical protein